MSITSQEDRKRYLGGSDAAGVLGVSPWATPLDVYLEKTGALPAKPIDPAREKMFRRGKRMEPVVLEMLDDELTEFGFQITKRSTAAVPNRYVDPEYDFLAAEIDFEWLVSHEMAQRYDLPSDLIGSIQNGEVKTVHPWATAKFGEELTEDVPIEYAAQAMHGQMVRGARLTMFAVLVGSDDLSLYWIHRDDATIAKLRAEEIRFWSEHVLKRVPPAPKNLPDVTNLFALAQPIVKMVDDATFEKYQEFVELKGEAKSVDGRLEDLKFEMGVFMLGEGAISQGPDGKILAGPGATRGTHVLRSGAKDLLTVRFQSQSRIDTEKVRRSYPDIAAMCSKSSEFWTFNLPRSKK